MPRFVPLLAACCLLSGCFDPGDGLEVPAGDIYFPVGLAMDASSSHLFVVSSDFDLQYNGGAIQAYDLGPNDGAAPDPSRPTVWDQLPERCSTGDVCASGSCDAGLCACPGAERASADQLLYPGRCAAIEPRRLQTSSVKIGAFATDAVMRQNPLDTRAAERLFVPVRGDSTLHWLDVTDGKLECGQANNDGICNERHRAGRQSDEENSRDLDLGVEPFAIDASASGETIVVTNQTTGTASLFRNDWTSEEGPELKFALSSDRIPSRPVGIVSLPQTPAEEAEDAATTDTFLMTFRNSAQVRLLRFAPDSESDPGREYLVDAGGVGIDANSVGSDSRGIAIDDSERKAVSARCNGDVACLDQAALVPIDVYVANRTPASLIIGRTRPPLEYPSFFQSLPLTVGPSRVVVGKLRTPEGELETRVFVVCFDSRRVFVYDPKRSRIESEILTGRGPYAVAVDTQRSLMYVGHFTDSYVGVFSLDLSSPTTYGTMLGTLGSPKPPRSSK